MIKRAFALIVPTLLLSPIVALAALTNPLQTASLSQFLTMLLRLVAEIASPIIVLMIVYIGFLFITAQGNPDKLKKAREYFLWAMIGALLVLGAYALSLAIEGTVSQL
ncbi:MAG: hypothetical protein AAB955_02350 [Patescibacteria group bacterium]